MLDIVTLDTPSLGDRSYVVTDGDGAVVIDPQRDIDRILTLVAQRELRITHVLETHMHNDYVSGGLALARATGAQYIVSAADDVAFEHTDAQDGDEIVSGRIHLRVVHTPGHTPNHLSYVLVEDGRPTAVFSGGSLLYGAVGRPDLVAPELTAGLAHAQHRSAHRLADMVPGEALVCPTHGFGSHCASTTTDDLLRDGTMAQERARNPALTLDEDAFVEHLLSGLHPYPAYYAHMGPLNLAGAPPVELTPPEPMDRDAIRRHIAQGHWVVDLRARRAFSADHVGGTINVELRNDLPTYLGWVIPWDVELSLLGETADDVAEAQRMLARIGLDRLAGAATGSPADWADGADRRTRRVAMWDGLADESGRDDIVVLDVRETWEFDSGHHPAAVHIPFWDLERRAGELALGEVWIYCATGNRAAVAASLLERKGRQVVLIDDFCLPGDAPGADAAVEAATS